MRDHKHNIFRSRRCGHQSLTQAVDSHCGQPNFDDRDTGRLEGLEGHEVAEDRNGAGTRREQEARIGEFLEADPAASPFPTFQATAFLLQPFVFAVHIM